MEPLSPGPFDLPGSRAGADFLQLSAAEAPARGLTDWLTDRVRTAITSGDLRVGAALPPSRVLAADLGVSRGTVTESYRRLAEEGLTTAQVGDATRVADRPAAAPNRRARPSRAGTPTAPLRLPLPADPAITVDLSPGTADLAAFPRAAWLRAESAVLRSADSRELGYGDPRGHPTLRRALAGWLARTRGIRVDPDDVLVVGGVAQTLALVTQVLRRAGRTRIACEDPGSRGARDELAHWGATPVPVPVDDDGLVVDDLADTDCSAVLVTPAHQFPTGVLLAPRRRHQVLRWAHERDHLVIEDDYDAEHRYDRRPTPALHASSPTHVLHTGSVSKTLAPALRLGWAVPPAHLLADLVEAKHASDLGSPALPQLVLAALILDGDLERHLRTTRRRHRARRDALWAALHDHLPRARVHGIAAGLHLTVTLPDHDLPDTDIADRAAAAGLRVQPLSWHRHRPGPPGLVLGYAAHPPDRLESAVRELARVLR